MSEVEELKQKLEQAESMRDELSRRLNKVRKYGGMLNEEEQFGMRFERLNGSDVCKRLSRICYGY
jgi:predicted RNase H-like nuclease (RuvC/YqgF family)